MRKRRMIQAAAVLMAAGILGGCSGSKEAASSGAEAAETKEAGGETAKESGKAEAGESEEAGEKGAPAADKNYDSTFDVASAGDVTLDVMITSLGDSDGGPYLRKVMDDYMAMYPNVTLTPVECSMNDLYTTLITQATAGTLPDIFTMTEAYLSLIHI